MCSICYLQLVFWVPRSQFVWILINEGCNVYCFIYSSPPHFLSIYISSLSVFCTCMCVCVYLCNYRNSALSISVTDIDRTASVSKFVMVIIWFSYTSEYCSTPSNVATLDQDTRLSSSEL